MVCVRYRYNEESRTRIKTVEIIVEKKQLPSAQSTPDNAIAPVQIAYGAKELGEMVLSAGGNWDADVKLWYIRYGTGKAYIIRCSVKAEKHLMLYATKASNIGCQHITLDAGI